MKKFIKLLMLPLILTSLTGCELLEEVFGGDTDTIHKKSYEPITGKFVLYDQMDKRVEHSNTYFEIDGSKGNFSIKYYEDGNLKRDGVFQRIVTYENKIGKIVDNLHLNVKFSDGIVEHLSTYTPSLDPINQFKIIEEYKGNSARDEKYYLSELPFVMGTYVREGESYQEEVLAQTETNYLTPTEEFFTCDVNGYFKLDDEHYFYFAFPGINSMYAFSYFQYYSPSLNKPLEGFVQGKTVTQPYIRKELYLTYSRHVLFDKVFQDLDNNIIFGYYTFSDQDDLIDHLGTVDFSSRLNSFTFEHLSREWTDDEWDEFGKDESYHMPDPIHYEYEGGTYTRTQ